MKNVSFEENRWIRSFDKEIANPVWFLSDQIQNVNNDRSCNPTRKRKNQLIVKSKKKLESNNRYVPNKANSHLLNFERGDKRQAMTLPKDKYKSKTAKTLIDIFHDWDDGTEIELTLINQILN